MVGFGSKVVAAGAVLLAGCFSPAGSGATTTTTSSTEGATTESATTGHGATTTVAPTSGTTSGATTESVTSGETTGTATTAVGTTTTTTEMGTTLVPTTETTLLETTLGDTTGVMIPVCGDGMMAGLEECDDGNVAAGDGCDPSCVVEYLVAFLSSDYFFVDTMNGLEGADEACNALAGAQILLKGRTFVAWLSDSKADAKDRIGSSQREYRLPDHTTRIAADSEALLGGTLEAAIEMDEAGVVTGSMLVWTGTAADGTAAVDQHCASWTMSDAMGVVGLASATNSTWSLHMVEICSSGRRLYCIEKAT